MNETAVTKKCIHGSMPPCACACPVNLDIKLFLKKIKSGNMNAAYRVLANALLFPGIVIHLCDGRCAASCAGNIDLRGLERAAVRNATRRKPNKYTVPPKKERVAIVGAGLAGMACALSLAAKRYPVTVFERGTQIGGTLSRVMDSRIYMEEFALQFTHAPYTLECGREIRSLDELRDFDAVFLATGKGGPAFDLLPSWNDASMATEKNGVFLGGELVCADKMEALSNGIVAAASIERYLKIQSMSGQPETFIRRSSPIKSSGKSFPPPILPAGDVFTAEEAAAEAERCAMCDCTLCMDRCEFLRWMGKAPPEIESIAHDAKNAVQGLLERPGSRMIFSCSVCGQCGSVCPEGVDLEPLLLDCKKHLHEVGHFSPALHEYYIRDMEAALGPDHLAKAAPGHTAARYVLFPGCQETQSGGEHIHAAYKWLRELYDDTGLLLSCCGIPALWSGDVRRFREVLDRFRHDWEALGQPTVVAMCPTCIKTLRRYLPEIPCTSLYEMLVSHGYPVKNHAAPSTEWAVFDPCASRDYPEVQQAVRQLAGAMGYVCSELPDHGPEARCCGTGGHIYPANPSLSLQMRQRAGEQTELPYLIYCANCRNQFLHSGKACSHILDGVFDLPAQTEACSLSAQKQNRKKLKSDLLRDIWREDTPYSMEQSSTINCVIPPDVQNKMDSLLITEEDVESVILHCEKTGQRVFRPESNICIGHLKIGYITYWVEYEKDSADQFRVINAYSHRVMLEGE